MTGWRGRKGLAAMPPSSFASFWASSREQLGLFISRLDSALAFDPGAVLDHAHRRASEQVAKGRFPANPADAEARLRAFVRDAVRSSRRQALRERRNIARGEFNWGNLPMPIDGRDDVEAKEHLARVRVCFPKLVRRDQELIARSIDEEGLTPRERTAVKRARDRLAQLAGYPRARRRRRGKGKGGRGGGAASAPSGAPAP